MSDRKYILVIRFSAMGDVALTVPVIRTVNTGKHKLLILTRKQFSDFFYDIEGAEIFEADLKGSHKGLKGILKLVKEINNEFSILKVVDLHSVLRTWIIGILFRLMGIEVRRIYKGRREKRKFVKTKVEHLLPHTTERYRQVFRESGLSTGKLVIPSFRQPEEIISEAKSIIEKKVEPGAVLVGISPFARHRIKSWGRDNIIKLMHRLDSEKKVFFFLFGGREDIKGLESIVLSFNNSLIMAGRYSMATELAVIGHLSYMISMDSANMHLAALSGIQTISIWGGTHPAMGFYPSGDQKHIVVQTPNSELGCRPCTVYGKGDCIRKDKRFKCLEEIKPEKVFDIISNL